jgi:hypothetical protein
MNLDRFHVLVARSLATAGFPTLRFACQGYGDSEGRGRPPRLLDHLEGTLDAVETMRRTPGVEGVALLGTRFGALVASLVTEQTQARMLAMCQPFARGDLFLNDCFQPALLRDTIRRKQGDGVGAGLRHDLETKGWTDVDGFLLTREAFEEIAALDVTRALTHFGGDALVIGVSRNGAVPRAVAEVAGHVRSLGADCREVGLADRWGSVFGQHQYQKLPDLSEVDTQFEVSRAISRSVVGWSLERVHAATSIAAGAGP